MADSCARERIHNCYKSLCTGVLLKFQPLIEYCFPQSMTRCTPSPFVFTATHYGNDPMSLITLMSNVTNVT